LTFEKCNCGNGMLGLFCSSFMFSSMWAYAIPSLSFSKIFVMNLGLLLELFMSPNFKYNVDRNAFVTLCWFSRSSINFPMWPTWNPFPGSDLWSPFQLETSVFCLLDLSGNSFLSMRHHPAMDMLALTQQYGWQHPRIFWICPCTLDRTCFDTVLLLEIYRCFKQCLC